MQSKHLSRRWRWFLLGYPWAALNTIIGLVLYVTLYRGRNWRWMDGVLTCVANREDVIGHPGAQTWGWAVVYTDPRYRTEPWAAGLRVHEHGHVKQGFVWGPLFLLAYAYRFLRYYFTKQPNELPGWHDDYQRNEFEVVAEEYGLVVDPDEWGARGLA